MASIIKNYIEYSGLADDLPIGPTSFKEFIVQRNLVLPESNPEIHQILKISAEVIVSGKKVIRTPIGTSLEGQILTGFKLVVEGELSVKAEYAAHEEEQPVYAAHFNTPFCTYIVLPKDFIIGTPITVTGYIDDITVDMANKRTIYSSVTVLMDAHFN